MVTIDLLTKLEEIKNFKNDFDIAQKNYLDKLNLFKKSYTNWQIGEIGESCTEVCQRINKTCDGKTLNSINRDNFKSTLQTVVDKLGNKSCLKSGNDRLVENDQIFNFSPGLVVDTEAEANEEDLSKYTGMCITNSSQSVCGTKNNQVKRICPCISDTSNGTSENVESNATALSQLKMILDEKRAKLQEKIKEGDSIILGLYDMRDNANSGYKKEIEKIKNYLNENSEIITEKRKSMKELISSITSSDIANKDSRMIEKMSRYLLIFFSILLFNKLIAIGFMMNHSTSEQINKMMQIFLIILVLLLAVIFYFQDNTDSNQNNNREAQQQQETTGDSSFKGIYT